MLIALAAVVAVFLVVKALDKNDKSSTTTSVAASQTQAWAEGTCSALVTWRSDVAASASTLKSAPTRANAKQAATDVKNATSSLADSLSNLGAPGTSASAKAQDTVQSLKTQMQTGVSKMQTAAASMSGISGSADNVATISATLVTMRDQITAAANALRDLPTGETQQAFATAPSCVKLKNGGITS